MYGQEHLCEEKMESAKFIEQKLASGTWEEQDLVFKAVLASAYRLMLDPHGSFVIRKFLNVGNPLHKKAFSMCISCNVLQLTFHQYGSKVMEEAIEYMPLDFQLKIIKELEGYAYKCATDQYGNQVLGRCIDVMDPSQLQTITRELKGEIVTLSKHQYGNYVIIRMLAKSDDMWKEVVSELQGHVLECAVDQYGNYVLQKCIDNNHSSGVELVYNEFKGEIISLSKDKHGSHLIQCLLAKPGDLRKEINEELDDDLVACAEDQYGNYVLQKCLDVTDPQIIKATIGKYIHAVPSLSTHMYGSRLIQAILDTSGDLWKEIAPQLDDHIAEYAMDQNGCHVVQAYLRCIDEEKMKFVFESIKPQLFKMSTCKYGSYVIEGILESRCELCTDVIQELGGHIVDCAKDMYGSYILRKCIDCRSTFPSDFNVIGAALKGHVFELAVDKAGSFVMERLMEEKVDMWKDIVQDLEGHVAECAENRYGSFILQKCVQSLAESDVQFIVKGCTGQVLNLSTSQYGCYIIQDIVKYCRPEDSKPIIEEVVANTECIMQNQYGNYVIKTILQNGQPEDKATIIGKISGKVLLTCRNKFASLVVLNCIPYLGREELAKMFDEVCMLPVKDLFYMADEPYVYHVVQKILEVGNMRLKRNCR